MTILWLIGLLLVPQLCSPTTLLRKTISNVQAVCNDHSKAKYYLNNVSSKKWVVYLESGGCCSTQERCNERYSSSSILMSANWLDADQYRELKGLDILSSNSSNPFHSYNHVYLPYCSSDMYVGMGDVKASPIWDGTDKNFVFAGYHIVHGLFEELKATYGEVAFTEIVLAGSSAGGVGVMNHIKLVKDMFTNAYVRGIVDSSWFINFEDNFVQLWNTDSAQSLTSYKSFPNKGSGETTGLCSFEYGGMPCCFQAACLQHHGAFKDTQLLFILSKNDIYLLQSSLIRSLQSSNIDEAFNMITYTTASYSGAMMLSLNSTKNTGLSYFITTCLQHVYLAPSSLWEEDAPLNELDLKQAEYYPLLKNLDLETFPINFSQSVTPGTMYTVRVGPTVYQEKALSEVISEWAADSTSMKYIHDDCLGVDCNPTCPDNLDITSNSWSGTVNIAAMAVLVGAKCVSTLI